MAQAESGARISGQQEQGPRVSGPREKTGPRDEPRLLCKPLEPGVCIQFPGRMGGLDWGKRG